MKPPMGGFDDRGPVATYRFVRNFGKADTSERIAVRNFPANSGWVADRVEHVVCKFTAACDCLGFLRPSRLCPLTVSGPRCFLSPLFDNAAKLLK